MPRFGLSLADLQDYSPDIRVPDEHEGGQAHHWGRQAEFLAALVRPAA